MKSGVSCLFSLASIILRRHYTWRVCFSTKCIYTPNKTKTITIHVASGLLTNCIYTSILSSLAKFDSGCAALKTNLWNLYVCFLRPPKIGLVPPDVSSAFSGPQKPKHACRCLICFSEWLHIYLDIHSSAKSQPSKWLWRLVMFVSLAS